MKRLMLLVAGVALAAVPAVVGLTDNPALSDSVPVRIPSGAVPVTAAQIEDFGNVRHRLGAPAKTDSATADASTKAGRGAPANLDASGTGRHSAPRRDRARAGQ